MKIFSNFLGISLIVLLGTGCTFQETNKPINDNAHEKTSEQKVSLTTEDVQGFLFLFEETASIITSEEKSFITGTNDPKLKKDYTDANGNDVPLMRYLGRKGLNNLEADNVKERLTTLKSYAASEQFSHSLNDVQQAHFFLDRFYSNISNLQSFNQFRDYLADFISAQDQIKKIPADIQLDYSFLKTEQPNLDYKMIESLVSVISGEFESTQSKQ